MQSRKIKIWGMILLGLSLACSQPSTVDPYSLIKEVGSLRYELRYRLPLSIHKGSEKTLVQLEQAAAASDGHQYFVLNVRTADGRAVEDILESNYGENSQAVLNALRFNLQENFEIQIGHSVLPCVLYHLETTPFKERGLNFDLVFKDDLNRQQFPFSEAMVLKFEDKLLSGQLLEFRFPATPAEPLSSIN